MKKRIVCMLGLVLVLGLAGCGTKEQASEEVQEEIADDKKEQEAEESEYIVKDTDITMEELREVNRPTALMKEHESLGFTWENYDADENLQSTVEAQFIFFEGKLWYDAVSTDSWGNIKTYYSDYEAEDMPGATYSYQEDPNGDDTYDLTIYPSDEYQYWVAQQWMPDLYSYQTEEITDISTQDGAIIMMVRTKYQDYDKYYDTMYYVDPDTKLILYREDSWYDEEGTLLSVDKFTPVYDEPYVSDGVARIAVTDAEDICELTVVFRPGQEEEIQTFRVAKGTYASVVSNTDYTLYSDPDCTNMINEISTQEDQMTVYVKMAETEDQAEIDREANDKSAQPADWYELKEDGYVLTLKLEDPSDDAYQWIVQNHYETVIQVEDEKHEDGMYIISLRGAMQEFGDAQIALQYTDAWDEQVQDTIVMDLFVNESGEIFVETADRM